MENKIVDIDLRIVRTNKMIRRVRQVRAMVKLAMKNMDNQYAYSTSDWLRGNILGDFIRKKRTDKLNSLINKVQQAMLDLESDLLVYDENLARSLRLPSRMAEAGKVTGIIDDIALRSKMRYKKFDVAKSLRNLDKVLARLEEDKNKLKFMKKDQKGLV